MVLELVAGRLTAKHLGSSLYTWTSVIGVVLAGITIGNYIGGRIADRFDAKKALSALFVIGSIACIATVILNNIVGDWILLWKLNWPLRVFTHVSLVFLLPSTLLGTISPVVAKMALDKGLPKGKTIGDIYAWGAAGSIAGTFAAGYYLIAAMGTIAIIWAVGGVLALMAVLFRVRLWPLYLWMAMFVLVTVIATAPVQCCRTVSAILLLREPIDPIVIYQDESQYCYIAVTQVSATPDKRFFIQDKLRHSEIIMGDINDLQYPYTRIYAGITRLLSKNKDKLNVMVIGGGGYVFPRYIETNWPQSRIDVVEIDPAVTKAAIEAFGLARNTSINTISMDARNYVEELLEKHHEGGQTPKYDFIYEDAINDYSVPYQLVTREFNDKIASILADDGAYMVNLIDTYDSGQFLGAVINTLQKTFPYVYVATNWNTHPAIRETFVVTATKRPFDFKAIEREKDLKIWRLSEFEIENLKKKTSGIVMTDDYAPVENLLAPVVLQGYKESLALRYMGEAKTLEAEGKWDQSMKAFENAARLNPTMSFRAYNEIAIMQENQNNLQEAARAYQNAIDYYSRSGAKQKERIASVYLDLGNILLRMGKKEDARKQFVRAVEEFRLELANNPSAQTWSQLGDTLGKLGDLKATSDAFEKAVALEPDNMTYRECLAKALEFQGRLDEAVEAVKKAIEFASSHGQQESAAAFNEYLKSLEQKKLQAGPK
jgi:tetratricopeptide (TPR) repeat protein